VSVGHVRLGPVFLTKECGRGGMGTVWHARHPDGVDVAVKILRPEFAADTELMSAFRREVRAVASMDHPAIVRVFDFGTVPDAVASQLELVAGSPWLAMEHADGTLGEIQSCTSWPELCDLLSQLLDGLAHSHARRIVHRDIKPRNVLVHRSSSKIRYTLTDFGIAQAWSRAAHHAEAGTPGYMAPEQIHGDWRALGPGTDLYALGCLAWRMATGRPPFEGPTAEAVMQAQVAGRVGRFQRALEVPQGFEDWLRQLMDVAPERRFRSAADAERALHALTSPGPAGAQRSIPGNWRGGASSGGSERQTTDRRNVSLARGTGLALFVLRPWPLVGREPVQDLLWSELCKVGATGRPRMVVLAGGPGIGKSRLARWVSERALETGAAWALRVGHDRSGSHGLREAVRVELRVDGLEPVAALERLVRVMAARGSPAPSEQAKALLDWLESSPPSQDLVPVMDLLDLWADDRPLVLWGDDLHWASDVIGLLARLGRGARKVLVVATLDPELVPPVRKAALEELVDAGLCIDLGPLEPEDHRKLVDGGVGLEPKLASKLVAKTAGNPAHAVWIVAEWARRGLLVPTSTGYGLRDPASFVLPEPLSMQLGAVLDELGSREVAALEALAILGGRVRQREWSGVCRARSVPIDDSLREALRLRGVVVPSDDKGEVRWSFSPPLLREVVLERAKAGDRLGRLHEACARVLSAEPRPQARERAVMHLVEGGRPDRALVVLRLLIEDVTRQPEAQGRLGSRLPPAQFLTSLLKSELHLLELVGAPPDDPRRVPGRTDALAARVERGEELDEAELRSLIALATSAGDQTSLQRLSLLALSAEEQRGTLAPDDPRLEEVMGMLAEAPRERLWLHRLRARAWLRAQDRAAAEQELGAALDLAEAQGDPNERAQVLLAIGELLAPQEPAEAEQCFSMAREAFQSARNPHGVAEVELSLSRSCRQRQDLVGAMEHARRAHALLARNKVKTAPADRELGLVRLARGEASQARTALKVVAQTDVVARCALLASTPAGGDWTEWDTLLGSVTDGLSRLVVDPDSAWPLEWAARRAADGGSLHRADATYRLAERQYQRVGDTAAVERMQKRLAALPQTVPQHAAGAQPTKITAAFRADRRRSSGDR
jgi:tetratricopeptide (TPR) repeat protein